MLTGLGLFAGGLLVAGAAPTFPVLLVGRAVAGSAAGCSSSRSTSSSPTCYPEELQPRVFGAMSTAWVLPSIVGPVLAGWLATHWSWRAVFLVVLPLALVLLPILAPQLRGSARAGEQDTSATRRRLLRGVGLAGGALALQAGSTPGCPRASCRSWPAALLVVVTLPGLVPPGALRLARGLPSLVAVRGLFTGTFAGAEAFIPLMLVEHRGITPAVAGERAHRRVAGMDGGLLGAGQPLGALGADDDPHPRRRSRGRRRPAARRHAAGVAARVARPARLGGHRVGHGARACRA